MARFTKIPESNLAGTLGSVLGKTAGSVGSKAMDTLNGLQDKLTEACKKVVEDQKNNIKNSEGYKQIEVVEKTLSVVEKTLNSLEKSANTLNSSVESIGAAVTSLKVSIGVIKALPIPQMYQVVALSMIEADLLTLLTETVAQIEQIVETVKSAIQFIIDLINKIRKLIAKLRKCLDALRISKALDSATQSTSTVDNLRSRGLLDDNNQDVFSKISQAIMDQKGLTDILWFGDLGGIDRFSTTVRNTIFSTVSNNYATIRLSNSGDWLSFAYYGPTSSKPATPTGRNLKPSGWVLEEPTTVDNWWYTRGTVSGLTGKVDFWTEPEPYSNKYPKNPGSTSYRTDYEGQTKSVLVLRLGQDQIKLNSFENTKTYAVIVTNVDDLYAFMLTALDSLNGIEGLEDLNLNTQPTVTVSEVKSESKYYYTSTTGDTYTFNIVVDSKSPKIARLRYVEVSDTTGVVVYTGTKSFTSDNDILLEETKLRFSQLFV